MTAGTWILWIAVWCFAVCILSCILLIPSLPLHQTGKFLIFKNWKTKFQPKVRLVALSILQMLGYFVFLFMCMQGSVCNTWNMAVSSEFPCLNKQFHITALDSLDFSRSLLINFLNDFLWIIKTGDEAIFLMQPLKSNARSYSLTVIL